MYIIKGRSLRDRFAVATIVFLYFAVATVYTHVSLHDRHSLHDRYSFHGRYYCLFILRVSLHDQHSLHDHAKQFDKRVIEE